ncbi:MAG: class I SAM-dependent methyltransferase [candidate division WOR-3 bacterium]
MDKKKISKIMKFYRKRLLEEENLYNSRLTKLDSAANQIIREPIPEDIIRLKNSLNAIYRTSDGLTASARLPHFLRKFIHRLFSVIMGSYLKSQNEFNSQVVHLINECIAHMEAHKKKEAALFDALMQFNQRIIALIDVRELSASYKNTKNLLNAQSAIIEQINSLKETLMVAYEGVDRKLLSFMAQQNALRQKLNSSDSVHRFQTSDVELRSFGIDSLRIDDEASALYLAFENHFRGPEEWVKTRFTKYMNLPRRNGKILDVGCGRGEFLELLKDKGYDAYGIDINSDMVKRCKEKGLEVFEEDALLHLMKLPDESISMIMCAHFIEHIPHAMWFRLLTLFRQVLISDGILILETLNPRSIYGMIEYYFKDPTHTQPAYPEYLQYLLELIGFKEIKTAFHSPVESALQNLNSQQYAQELLENIERLNKFLFDQIEYSITAKK